LEKAEVGKGRRFAAPSHLQIVARNEFHVDGFATKSDVALQTRDPSLENVRLNTAGCVTS
jgi:hypothetical protein